ncbi:class I tRNA ligase family protein, partial [Candidatus Wolfebacteria bacterium]|nr:class I tRNA ligase family protein [Candidatus Wolfebacteria bacterium]
KNDDGVKQTLAFTLAVILKLLHPFMPFITEEIWGELLARHSFSEGGPIKDKKLLIVENWP